MRLVKVTSDLKEENGFIPAFCISEHEIDFAIAQRLMVVSNGQQHYILTTKDGMELLGVRNEKWQSYNNQEVQLYAVVETLQNNPYK